ncbi:MAG: hypothetical protein WBQ73_01370, partial [Candidatus Babeliales bacterium]
PIADNSDDFFSNVTSEEILEQFRRKKFGDPPAVRTVINDLIGLQKKLGLYDEEQGRDVSSMILGDTDSISNDLEKVVNGTRGLVSIYLKNEAQQHWLKIDKILEKAGYERNKGKVDYYKDIPKDLRWKLEKRKYAQRASAYILEQKRIQRAKEKVKRWWWPW